MKNQLSILIVIVLLHLNSVALGISYETFPKFQDRDLPHFRNWVQQRIVYPRSALQSGIEGRIFIEFCVETDGSLSNIQEALIPITETYCHDSALVREAIRVIEQSPRWTPGYQRDKPVKVIYFVPVDFTLPAKLSLDTTVVYKIVEMMPTFNGGDTTNFRNWAHERVTRPPIGGYDKNGRVVLSFIVERDGSVSTIKVLQSPDKLLSKDAVKVVSSSPRWSPGVKNGESVRVEMVVSLQYDYHH